VNIGNKYPVGDIKADCWEKVYENTLTSATNSVTISNLEGNTDEVYKLIVRAVDDGNTVEWVGLRPNNDSGSNYGYQRIHGVNAAVSAARGTSTRFLLTNIASTTPVGIVEMLLYAKSGYIRTAIIKQLSNASGTSVYSTGVYGLSWSNTADEITSLVIYAESDELGIGSYIALYRKLGR